MGGPQVYLLGGSPGNATFQVRGMGGDPYMVNILGGFHHRVAQWITGKFPHRRTNRIWRYPPLEEAMIMSGLEELDTYIPRRNNTVGQYIATLTSMDIRGNR